MNLRLHQDHDHCHEEEEEALPVESMQAHVIFDAEFSGEKVPAGFDAVRIPLDGTLKSSLDWSAEALAAKEYAAQGIKIFWDLDLGLSALPHPLEHEGQFQTLLLSLVHFRDTLWQQFRQETMGLCLYRGIADFRYADYLSLLAQSLPDFIPKYVLLDVSHVESAAERAQFLSKEHYFHFVVGAKGTRCCGGELGWGDRVLSRGYLGREIPRESYVAPTHAICLSGEMKEVFEGVEGLNIPYRVIPESMLTSSWDGIDVIYVDEKFLTSQGKRMLMGFQLSGGEIR